jgi:hypothetical protein
MSTPIQASSAGFRASRQTVQPNACSPEWCPAKFPRRRTLLKGFTAEWLRVFVSEKQSVLHACVLSNMPLGSLRLSS